ncbi:GNAT family N-acetyltransferase [Mesobacillus foraminis]|uniref:N-acetyltransferase domain-containing protein n=1 Tax=Mesobacillus foraminis TaxID=279826 RepID=A0A4V2RE54_9BACI|nr:GNAT family N-acetyltransferase [Mesobacillus foraminis]TCN27390.1 hypothetical protein EV146_102340 [Mesobacillus foraminis]
MIRKLTGEDNGKVMDFLSDEPSINLFIIGDIEAFGYDTSFQELWGEFTEDGTLIAVFLRFHNSFIPYAKGSFSVHQFAEIMKLYSDRPVLSGKAAIVEQFERAAGLSLGRKQQTFFAECRTTDHLGSTDLLVEKAAISDVDRIIQLRSTIDEFVVNENAHEMLIQAMESGTGRTFYTEEDGTMTACASTAAENSMSAMVVGVCTHKNYRRKGHATAVMQKLFKDVLEEGRILCLFYDNPDAGRIYKRLGFKEIGMWTMYR